MCGRYALYEAMDLDKRFNLATKPTFVSQDNYNVSPMQRLPVIYEEDGRRVAELMQWGFLPFFAKDPKKSFRPINTVSETAFDKPMWREAAKHHRCLVPARGFFEWQKFYGEDEGVSLLTSLRLSPHVGAPPGAHHWLPLASSGSHSPLRERAWAARRSSRPCNTCVTLHHYTSPSEGMDGLRRDGQVGTAERRPCPAVGRGDNTP